MNTLKIVNEKLFGKTELKSEKVELSAQKVELARKPQSILSEANKLDSKLRGMESKIEKAYLNYKQNQKEWVSKLSDIQQDADKLEDDLVKILDAAQEIGVDGRLIDGFSTAADLVTMLQRITNDGKSLYPSIK
jgi:TolA-binding protein